MASILEADWKEVMGIIGWILRGALLLLTVFSALTGGGRRASRTPG